MREIEIIGAGLAGLALGNALQRHDVPVTIHEAGTLPRHRVCGEFICGKGAKALESLGLQDALNGACRHSSTVWYIGEKETLRKKELPTPAIGLSRYILDQRLASSFQAAGGQLKLKSRKKFGQDSEGRILCHGRKASPSNWLGLKFHTTALETAADLELHLSANGYVGLSRIEAGKINVCALFQRVPDIKAKRTECLLEYLKYSGLHRLAERLTESNIIDNSHCGVAGVEFSRIPRENDSTTIRLGDAYSVIPPFTGNGMSIALEAAQLASPSLLKYATGSISWQRCSESIQNAQARSFNNRLRAARCMHPLIHTAKGQHILSTLAGARLLPFSFLYSITH